MLVEKFLTRQDKQILKAVIMFAIHRQPDNVAHQELYLLWMTFTVKKIYIKAHQRLVEARQKIKPPFVSGIIRLSPYNDYINVSNKLDIR